MVGIVPLLCFAVLVFTYAALSREGPALARWRASFLAAAVTWGLTVTAITEALSLFGLITLGWLLTLWVGALLLSAAVCVRVSTRERLTALLQRPAMPRLEFWCVAAVATLAAVVGLVAVAAPPNNADSMTYHMPRVMHWAQNQSVAHYPTNVLRQILRPPWSGFAIMQFQVLTGDDQWANLVQWFSMVGSVVGVSLIARHLGADPRGQVLAAVMAATIPMGILQASSTQNDYVTAFWLVCLTHYAFRFKTRPCWANALGAGASLALALLTKGTAYLYAAPLLVWLTLSTLRSLRWRAWPPLLLIAVIVLGVNLGHYARNVDLSGRVLSFADEDDSRTTNTVLGVGATVSNVIRNMSLHVGTLSGRFNGWLHQGIRILHVPLGIGASDPRTTDGGDRGFYQRPFGRDEDSAGNPIHLALMLVGIALLLVSREERRARDVAAYALPLVIAFVVFCAYLKWSPWHSRLHLPLFVLWSPLVSLVLLRRVGGKIALPIAVLLMATSTVYVFGNELRPLIGAGPGTTVLNTGRVDQIFRQFSGVKDAYLAAARVIAAHECSEVGLDTGLEYPVWVVLQKMKRQPIRIEHANVTNISAARATADPFAGFSPCAVLVDSNCSPPCSRRESDKEALFEGGPLAKTWSSGRVSVFGKREPSRSGDGH